MSTHPPQVGSYEGAPECESRVNNEKKKIKKRYIGAGNRCVYTDLYGRLVFHFLDKYLRHGLVELQHGAMKEIVQFGK